MISFDRAHLKGLDFRGFVPLRSLPRGCREVPAEPGVYVAVRQSGPPGFLERSVGGHFKGADPTVACEKLSEKWLDDVEVLYIGKSGNLRRRIDEFARFGRGEPIGHRGGRYIWQLSDHDALQIAWVVDAEPEAREAVLVDEFVAVVGSLPFANLNRPRGVVAK